MPFEGYLVDRLGTRWVVGSGGLLVGVAWWINSGASSLVMLYAGDLVGGVVAGIVYGTSVGSALMIMLAIGTMVVAEPAPNAAAVRPAARPR